MYLKRGDAQAQNSPCPCFNPKQRERHSRLMIINNTTPQANTPNGTDPNYRFLNLQFNQAATARLILSFFFGHSPLWNFAC
jgi:hypothetical protein